MIKVDIEGLREEERKLASDMLEFQSYSKNFINNTVSQLEGFNSDFISEIKSTLKNMTDTKAPKLMENLEDFYTSLHTLLEDFEKTDETIANSKKRE